MDNKVFKEQRSTITVLAALYRLMRLVPAGSHNKEGNMEVNSTAALSTTMAQVDSCRLMRLVPAASHNKEDSTEGSSMAALDGDVDGINPMDVAQIVAEEGPMQAGVWPVEVVVRDPHRR